MNPKENDNEIIELTDEELDEIFADDDFDNGDEGGEMTEIIPVPRILIFLSYQLGAFAGCFLKLRLI